MELCGDKPRIELFAREKAEGWDALGNEIDGKDILDALKEITGQPEPVADVDEMESGKGGGTGS